jgi:tetratricopeptide (TPR) repeat protein
MKQSFDKLGRFIEDKEIASRVRYWRGFAMWRKAINGFNDSIDPAELEKDLQQAVDEFGKASELDPGFVDAKVGLVSCYGYVAFLNRSDPAKSQEWFGKSIPAIKETKIAAPDNPRLLWVMGPILWNTPPDRGGGQDKAIANYERGLEIIRKNEPGGERTLDPTWGKPELVMNLAWSHLNRTTPDLEAAERNARSALELVPHWHYVRDILLPQILDKKTKVK